MSAVLPSRRVARTPVSPKRDSRMAIVPRVMAGRHGSPGPRGAITYKSVKRRRAAAAAIRSQLGHPPAKPRSMSKIFGAILNSRARPRPIEFVVSVSVRSFRATS